MGKRVKNKDIATRLGVSGTLVSLVLNNKGDKHGIKKETQERVMALARQMGYYDSDKESKPQDDIYHPPPIEPVEKEALIGMVVASLHDPFVYAITPWIHRYLNNLGVALSLISKNPDDKRFSRLVGGLRNHYSGLILVGDAADDYTMRTLNSMEYPFMMVEKTTKKLRLNTVSTDIDKGNEILASHVAELGYSNIVIFQTDTGSKSDIPEVVSLTKTLANYDTINPPVTVKVGPPVSDESIYYDTFRNYLKPPFRADLFIVANPELVAPLVRTLNNNHVRVPQDVAIISMEDAPGLDLMQPSITALQKPLEAMAAKISKIIWNEVKSRGRGKFRRQVVVQHNMIIRKSCGSYIQSLRKSRKTS